MVEKLIRARSVDYPDIDSYILPFSYQEVTECPACHFALQPSVLSSFYVAGDAENKDAYYLYQTCLCNRCRQVFLSKYEKPLGLGQHNPCSSLQASFSVPLTPKTDSFSNEIEALSPSFVETYSQASIAEAQQLTQICGVGYRKSLEFLVKDYLCHKHPDDAEKIRSEFLGASIKRIEDNRVKVLAERSTWIGNDETHYVRKHDNLTLESMKRFIKAILSYIESELAFEEADSIPRK